MYFIEVLERSGQLRQDSGGVAQVHAADVVALERVDETLGHAVALRTAHGSVHRFEPELSSHAARFVSDVGAPPFSLRNSSA